MRITFIAALLPGLTVAAISTTRPAQARKAAARQMRWNTPVFNAVGDRPDIADNKRGD